MVEQRPVKASVVGSSPTTAATLRVEGEVSYCPHKSVKGGSIPSPATICGYGVMVAY